MTKSSRWKEALFLAAMMTGTLPAFAQDVGLYEDVVDPNASFVRVVGVNLDRAKVDTTLIDQMDAGVSGYVVINQPGDISIVTGVDESTVKIEPGRYYSFVVGADGTGSLVTEDITSSPAQAVVSFFNLSDKPLVDLFVPAAKAVAVGAVAQGGSGLVALKAPLTLDFEMREGTDVLASVPAVELKRRAGVAIVFSGSAGAYSAVMVPSTIVR